MYFRAGVAISAEEGTLGETLGRILLDDGKLTADQYRTIIERMTRALIEDEQMRFGEVAVELGYLAVDEVRLALAEQVRRRILRCLLWDPAAWAFHESPSWLEGVGRFPTPIEPIVFAAARGPLGPARVAAVLSPHLARYPWLAGEAARDVGTRFGLDGADLRVLESFDGWRTVAEHVAVPATGEAARALLAALVLADAVPLLDAQRPPKFVAERRRADAAPPAPAPEVGPAVAAAPAAPIPTAVPGARASMPPPSKPAQPTRAVPGSQRAKLLAEEAFLKGKEHLRAEKFKKAATDFREAATLLPDASEYGVYAGWAELCDCADKARPPIEKALREGASLAVRHNSEFAFGVYVLGHLALRDNRPELAERYFRAASRLDAKLVDATRHVMILERRRLKK